MRLLRPLAFVLLGSAIAAGPVARAQATEAPPAATLPTLDAAAVDRLALEAIARWELPGLAIAIVDHDRVVYLKGFGVKTAGGSDPVGPDTRFQVGSVTKQFTTTLMAMLVDEKKMRWDDPVRAHLDWFRLSDPAADSLVTLRDLVSHRTGLAEHDELWDDSPWTRQEVIRRAGALPLASPFRSRYRYNNIMLMAAGEAAASAAKTPWERLVKERIFTPLGMASSGVTEAEWLAAKDRAAGFKRTDEGKVVPQIPIPNDLLGPAGTLHSTARDFSRWLRFQLAGGAIDGKRLLSEEALEETRTPQNLLRLAATTRDSNPETNLMAYGMAWVVQDWRGELLVSHTGSLNGFRARVDLLPKRSFGVALMTNLGRAPALVALRSGIVDLLLAGRPTRDWNEVHLGLEAKAEARSAEKKKEAEAKRPVGTKPSHDLAAYAGPWQGAAHGTMTVAVEDGGLVLKWNRLKGPLVHAQYDTFTWKVGEPDNLEETVQFTLDAAGRVDALRIFDVSLARAAP